MKCGEFFSDFYFEFMDFGIDWVEGSGFLVDEEDDDLEFRWCVCIEWCIE